MCLLLLIRMNAAFQVMDDHAFFDLTVFLHSDSGQRLESVTNLPDSEV